MAATAPTEPTRPSDPDALLRPDAAAAFLDVTARCLEAWRSRGGGPRFVRVSARAVRYRRRDLVAWAEARLRSSTSDDPESRAVAST